VKIDVKDHNKRTETLWNYSKRSTEGRSRLEFKCTKVDMRYSGVREAEETVKYGRLESETRKSSGKLEHCEKIMRTKATELSNNLEVEN